MFLKNKGVQLCFAISLGIVVMLLPRPEGTKFTITGVERDAAFQSISQYFTDISTEREIAKAIIKVEAKDPGGPECSAEFIKNKAAELNLAEVEVGYDDGLSPKAKRFLAVLIVLIFLFVAEP
ncbi:MAG: anion transporter, partial [Deltaproteobacteria bacterium]|nr:anion transporter [Deltaproteobacteria bacterium]